MICAQAHARVGPRLGFDGQWMLFWQPADRLPIVTARGDDLFFSLEQVTTVVPDPRYSGEFKMQTEEYRYSLYTSQRLDVEPLVYWHWNRNNDDWPEAHLHAPIDDPLGRGIRLHLPTGSRRVTFESVIKFLIAEGLAVPEDEDSWEGILADGQARFEAFQTQDPDPSSAA